MAVRVSAARQEHIRVHRIPPRVRDDREPPLCGSGRVKYKTDLGQAKSDISEIPNRRKTIDATGARRNPRSDWANSGHDAGGGEAAP